MKKLEATLKAFKEIVESNLSGEEQNHYQIINCLGNVFFEANEELKLRKTLDEKAAVFNLMKTLHPFLTQRKEAIADKFDVDTKLFAVELKLAFAVFDKESLNYSKNLRRANKERVRRSKKKYKNRDYL